MFLIPARLDRMTSNSDQSVPAGIFAALQPRTSVGFHDNERINLLSNVYINVLKLMMFVFLSKVTLISFNIHLILPSKLSIILEIVTMATFFYVNVVYIS